MNINSSRRKWLRLSSLALASIPVMGVGGQASAATNAPLRATLKYQDTPKDGNSCSTCLEFVPGKTAMGLGGCKQIPGDDEIAATGWCVAWNTL